jgi:hypothetical protein
MTAGGGGPRSVGGAGAMSPCAGEHGVPVVAGETLGAPLCKSYVDHQHCTPTVRLSVLFWGLSDRVWGQRGKEDKNEEKRTKER